MPGAGAAAGAPGLFRCLVEGCQAGPCGWGQAGEIHLRLQKEQWDFLQFCHKCVSSGHAAGAPASRRHGRAGALSQEAVCLLACSELREDFLFFRKAEPSEISVACFLNLWCVLAFFQSFVTVLTKAQLC